MLTCPNCIVGVNYHWVIYRNVWLIINFNVYLTICTASIHWAFAAFQAIGSATDFQQFFSFLSDICLLNNTRNQQENHAIWSLSDQEFSTLFPHPISKGLRPLHTYIWYGNYIVWLPTIVVSMTIMNSSLGVFLINKIWQFSNLAQLERYCIRLTIQ